MSAESRTQNRLALAAIDRQEQELLALGSAGQRGALRMIRSLHHDFLRVAQALEVEALEMSDVMQDRANDLAMPEELRSLNQSRAKQFHSLAALHGEAWMYYERIMDRPVEVIVLEMCKAGFCDHARYIITGEWCEEKQ